MRKNRTFQPETGGRAFEDNQAFFIAAAEQHSWRVGKVADGKYRHFPGATKESGADEEEPLLGRLREQL